MAIVWLSIFIRVGYSRGMVSLFMYTGTLICLTLSLGLKTWFAYLSHVPQD